jgi:hypothetical protein
MDSQDTLESQEAPERQAHRRDPPPERQDQLETLERQDAQESQELLATLEDVEAQAPRDHQEGQESQDAQDPQEPRDSPALGDMAASAASAPSTAPPTEECSSRTEPAAWLALERDPSPILTAPRENCPIVEIAITTATQLPLLMMIVLIIYCESVRFEGKLSSI